MSTEKNEQASRPSADVVQKNERSDNGADAVYGEKEVGTIDFLLVLARNRTLLLGTLLFFVGIGFALAIFSPEEYQSQARLVRESQQASPGGISGGLSALRGLGINLGTASDGLSPEAYPDLLLSREVRRSVIHDTVRTSQADSVVTYMEYHANSGSWAGAVVDVLIGYTIGLPGKLIALARGGGGGGGASHSLRMSRKEYDAMRAISDGLTTSTDPETGILSISIAMQDPVMAAEITQSFVVHLRERVRTIRTEKARQDLEFVETRFHEVEEQFRQAQERLAAFEDRNQNITSARLQTERNRLRREVQFKADLYSELQTQVTQAEINLQRSQPVVTVVEAPIVPLKPSAPRRLVILVVSTFFGLIIGIGLVYLRSTFDGEDDDSTYQAKMEEIRTAFIPGVLRQQFLSASTHSNG